MKKLLLFFAVISMSPVFAQGPGGYPPYGYYPPPTPYNYSYGYSYSPYGTQSETNIATPYGVKQIDRYSGPGGQGVSVRWRANYPYPPPMGPYPTPYGPRY